MKTYTIIIEKTISQIAENKEELIKRVKRHESNENKDLVKIKKIIEEPEYRYVTFTELIDMYAAPKSPIEYIKPVFGEDDSTIDWFSIKFKGLNHKSVLMVNQFGSPAPTDTAFYLKREVNEQ